MNRFKRITALFAAVYLILAISACSGEKAEYESTQGFEFHFYPEEYEEEYSEVSKTLYLETGTDYQLQIDAACENGTMEVRVMYQDADEKVYIVNADDPRKELLPIPANDASAVTITISIEPNTKGTVIGDLLAAAK